MFSSSGAAPAAGCTLGDMEKGGRLAPRMPLPCSTPWPMRRWVRKLMPDEYPSYAKHYLAYYEDI